MDHRFREDENELPYLLYQKRDDSPSRPSYNYDDSSNDEKLDRILNSMYISTSERLALKNKLLSFLNAKDCTGLKVEDNFDACSFIIIRENDYVLTEDEFIYIPGSDRPRIFMDCYTTHSHDKLLRDSRFIELVKRTGFEFIGCSGGYESKYFMADDKFELLDEVNVKVSFRVGSKKRMYMLDLNRMELSEKYFEYGDDF